MMMRHLVVLLIVLIVVNNALAQKPEDRQPGSYMRNGMQETNARWARQEAEKKAKANNTTRNPDSRNDKPAGNKNDPGTVTKYIESEDDNGVVKVIPYELPQSALSYNGDKDLAGAPSGQGLMKWQDGSSYQGTWLSGKENGKGIRFFSDGTFWNGVWKDGFFLSGKKNLLDRLQSGNFIKGKLTGIGEVRFKNGDKVNANYSEGEPVTGTLITASGNTYEGGFDLGYASGIGIMTYKDGNYFIGHFANDNAEGYGKLFNAKGVLLQEGDWASEKLIAARKDIVPEVEVLIEKKNLDISRSAIPAAKKNLKPGVKPKRSGPGKK